MAFIGASIVLLIGITIFAGVSDSIVCPVDEVVGKQCEQVKETSWTIIGILPVVMFFIIFSVFGGLTGTAGITDWLKTNIKTGKNKLSRSKKYTNKLTLKQKIMILLRLAEVKRT